MKDSCDVVIIGAGIGGLVCGCYLAKSGLEVLIVEQHDKPGGYCTSFERKGYKFDVGGHYLGGIKSGWMSKVFCELEIQNKIKFIKFDPTDKIVMPDNIVYIRNDIGETISGFKKVFSSEKRNIDNFFKMVLKEELILLYTKLKRLNFQEVLNKFFYDPKLKSALEILLGNIGLCAERTSAVSAILLFRNFISDPGWYPKGGIQILPDTLKKIIESSKGKVILRKRVKKIVIENDRASGVLLDDNSIIRATAVVSNADATLTFQELLDRDCKERNMIDQAVISPSMFCVYLGMKESARNIIKEGANVWYFSTYDIKSCYSDLEATVNSNAPLEYCVAAVPFMHDDNILKPTIELFIAAPFKDINFWDQNREYLMQKVIDRAEQLFPGLKQHIDIKLNATPHTFHHYTLNRAGAAYGWASTKDLILRPLFMTKTSVERLFLAGHWCNGGLSQGGIPQVSIMGRTAARFVTESLGIEWKYKHNLLR